MAIQNAINSALGSIGQAVAIGKAIKGQEEANKLEKTKLEKAEESEVERLTDLTMNAKTASAYNPLIEKGLLTPELLDKLQLQNVRSDYAEGKYNVAHNKLIDTRLALDKSRENLGKLVQDIAEAKEAGDVNKLSGLNQRMSTMKSEVSKLQIQDKDAWSALKGASDSLMQAGLQCKLVREAIKAQIQRVRGGKE